MRRKVNCALWAWPLCVVMSASGQVADEEAIRAAELEECRQTLEVAWSEVEGLREELEATRQELAAAKEGGAAVDDRAEQREQLLARMRKALVAQRAKMQAAESRVASLEEQLDAALGAASATGGAEETSALQERLQDVRAQLQERDITLADLETELGSARETAAGLETARAEAVQRAGELEAMLAERDQEIAELRDALAVAEETVLAGAVDEEFMEDAGEETSYRLIVKGNEALRQNRIDEAEALFNRALEMDRELIGARLGLAACHYARSNFDYAKELVGQVLRDDRNNPQALGLAGIIAWQEGDLRTAGRRLEKAIRLDANDAQLHNYAGIVYHARGRQAEAIQVLRRAVELDPMHAEAMFNLAVLLATDKIPNLDEARMHYEKAVSLGSARDDKLEQLINP